MEPIVLAVEQDPLFEKILVEAICQTTYCSMLAGIGCAFITQL